MDQAPVQPDNSGLFVIRLHRPEVGCDLRGWLEHVLSGRRHAFADAQGLLASLRHERSLAERRRPGLVPGSRPIASTPPDGTDRAGPGSPASPP